MKPLKLITFKKKVSTLVILLSLLITSSLFFVRCSKEPLQNQRSSVLSPNSGDYAKRLENIKDNYLRLGFADKFKAKKSEGITYIPSWQNPQYHIVNDSVSYVFYKMIGHMIREGKTEIVEERNGATYLMVKNEKEYYRAFYYIPTSQRSDSVRSADSRLNLKNFNGKLLITNLQTKESFVVDYANGTLSSAYRKMTMGNPKTSRGLNGKLSYYQEFCTTSLRFCQFITDGPSWCGGAYITVYRDDCTWPVQSCHDVYILVDYTETTYCEYHWFPDPPQTTDPGGVGDNGGVQLSDASISSATYYNDNRPAINNIKEYTNCFTDGKPAQSYTMTIFVHQPVNGSGDYYKITEPGVIVNNVYGVPSGIVWTTPDGNFFNVGHTFVTFEKNNTDGTNVRQTLGFYPSNSSLSSPGAIKDNSRHDADVSFTMNVNADQFNSALQKVEHDFISERYVLTNIYGTEYNCTDAAISWMNAAGAGFGTSTHGLFINTPGSFGQILRLKQGADLNPQIGIQGKGPCN